MAYSKKERFIAELMSYLPWLKPLAKRAYQTINYLIYKPKSSFISDFQIHELGEKGKESFFGYYDKSPLNETNEYLIFHQTSHPSKLKPSAQKSIEIVLYHLATRKTIKSWETNAYNWQQGAKPMWLDKHRFSFNFFDSNTQSYKCRIVDIQDIENSKIIDSPLYDANNKLGLSLSFERLNQIMPDYGYRNITSIDKRDESKDGIFLLNFEKTESKLLFSIAQIIELHHQKTMDNATHWFNHIQLSPNGEQFMFLHRWSLRGKKYDALILSDITAKNIQVLANDGMVSHCFWKNDQEIISYMRDEKRGDQYYLIDIKNGSRTIIGQEEWKQYGDGHPHSHNNQMIFDTYPNRSRMKELFLFDFKTQKLSQIGAFLEPMKYFGETRCDLHPRFSMDAKKVFFDSVHTGKRKLYYMDLEEAK